jgi:hypothetical protein
MDPDQTAGMRRLVWIHAGRKRTMLDLSWHGSFSFVNDKPGHYDNKEALRLCMYMLLSMEINLP